MKSIICIIFLFLCGIAWGQDGKKFVINGSIPGIKDGLEVGLYDNNNEKVTEATTKTKDGKFVLEGSLDYPVLCFLCIDMTPEVQDIYQKEKRGSALFLDNSVIAYSCESVDVLPLVYGDPSHVKVIGSQTHDLYQAYLKSLATSRTRYKELAQAYMEVYYRPALEGVFNTRQGIAIVKDMDEVNKQMQEVRWQFLKMHGNSIVGIEVAMEILSYAGSSYTKVQINDVLETIDVSLRQGKAYAGLKEMAENMYPVAKDEKYMDIELTDVDGKMVRLADYVKAGQYTMLEFWASWCGPCRGEIPHLRHVHSLYGDAFNMISISIDEREKDWEKALKEESMVWTQLNDRKGMSGPVISKYKVYGVPYSLILDKEGKIIAGGVRGAELDNVLVELLGDKF